VRPATNVSNARLRARTRAIRPIRSSTGAVGISARGAQPFEHRAHAGLATIGRPGCVDPNPDAGAPIGKAEAAQPKDRLQFRRMLPPSLVSVRVVGKRRRRHADLVRHERDHRLGRPVAGAQALPRVAEEAELHGKPKAVHAAPLGPDERQVIGAQHLVARHLGRIGRDSEQAVVLLRGEQGAAGHGNLVLDGKRQS